MARLSRFVAVAVLLGGATVSLSACTGGSDPVVSPSPSVTASATPTPSVSPTPTALSEEELLALIPEVARRSDFIGASEFARFVLAQYEEMFLTLDTSLWEAVTSPECEFCTRSVADVTELRDSGGTREGGHMVLDPASGLALGGLRDDGFYYVGFRFEISAWTDRDSAANVLGEGSAAAGETALKMQFVDGHWVVLGIDTQVTQ